MRSMSRMSLIRRTSRSVLTTRHRHHVRGLLGQRTQHAPLQQPQRAADRGQRRAQLVTDDRQELVLQALALTQRRLRLHELALGDVLARGDQHRQRDHDQHEAHVREEAVARLHPQQHAEPDRQAEVGQRTGPRSRLRGVADLRVGVSGSHGALAEARQGECRELQHIQGVDPVARRVAAVQLSVSVQDVRDNAQQDRGRDQPQRRAEDDRTGAQQHRSQARQQEQVAEWKGHRDPHRQRALTLLDRRAQYQVPDHGAPADDDRGAVERRLQQLCARGHR